MSLYGFTCSMKKPGVGLPNNGEPGEGLPSSCKLSVSTCVLECRVRGRVRSPGPPRVTPDSVHLLLSPLPPEF